MVDQAYPLVSQILQIAYGPSSAVAVGTLRQKLSALIAESPEAAREMFFQSMRGRRVNSGRFRQALASAYLRSVDKTAPTPQAKVGDILAAFTVTPNTKRWNQWALNAAKQAALTIKDRQERQAQLDRIAADAKLVDCEVY